MKKNTMSKLVIAVLALLCTLLMAVSALAEETFANTITVEALDWGPAITKVTVALGKEIKAEDLASLAVTVTEHKERPNRDPMDGERAVTGVRLVNADGSDAADASSLVEITLAVGPTESSPIYGSATTEKVGNMWFDVLTLTVHTPEEDVVLDFHQDQVDFGVLAAYDAYVFTSSENVDFTTSVYTPVLEADKHPLIIWFHGVGEGGDDPTINLTGTKVLGTLISDELQAEMGGAYVLAPQFPNMSMWMDNGQGIRNFETGTMNFTEDGSCLYTDDMKELLDSFVAEHPDVDINRIYVGGCSNGGYMTMAMVLAYPDYFAAAFPICEAYLNAWISDEQIASLVNLPIWFVQALGDTTIANAMDTSLPTLARLRTAGAADVRATTFDGIYDLSGLYLTADGTPHHYHSHYAWIPVGNRQCYSGDQTELFAWLAAQSK